MSVAHTALQEWMVNNMRLIDADELLELYEMGKEFEDYAKALSVPIPVIQQNIKDMPTIDAVPVVRCKDCDSWCEELKTGSPEFGNEVAPCSEWSNEDGYTRYTKPTDFCSHGDPKESE